MATGHEESAAEFRVGVEGVQNFVICLAVGSIRLMKEGKINDAGSLGLPVFCQYLRNHHLLDREVFDALVETTELQSLREEVSIDAFQSACDRLVRVLVNHLAEAGGNEWDWYARCDTIVPLYRS